MLAQWLSLMFTLLHVSLFAQASPRHEVEDFDLASEHPLHRRQNPTVVITGIQSYGIQPRLEIRQLQKNADQWNLFLLGLARFQQTNQSDLTSYYQIAGIHGRPYIPWDGVQPAPGQNAPGYCMHVLNLFLAWHRPYLALFEQTLAQHIVAVVNEFPPGAQRARYARAAISWRFPYWDWAAPPPAGQSSFPTSLQTPTVSVALPNGSTANIPNPLYSYRFHPTSIQDFYFNPFATWTETKRYPTSWNPDAVSQNQLLGPVFDNNRVSFQDRLYNLFTNYDNFTEFGNEAWMGSGEVQNADSLEAIHDAIHSILGSNGHMTYLDYSAYDPTFWLHHAMLDRCFALWQALYPNSYVEPGKVIEQTFTLKPDDWKDQNSPLQPFFSNSSRGYWTAASVRDFRTFGYTYPELAGNANSSTVKAAINKLYGSSAGSSGLSKRAVTAQGLHDRELPGAFAHIQANKVPGEVIGGKHRQYVANILSQKFALNGSYAIYVFMGDFDKDPTTWPTSPNLVGTHAVFAALDAGNAANNPAAKSMKSRPAIQVTGSMPLTSMLLAKVGAGELRSMKPDRVEDYLEHNLHWRVGMFDGTEVPALNVADLTITVVSAEVKPAASSKDFPEWTNFVELTRITRGRAGGC